MNLFLTQIARVAAFIVLVCGPLSIAPVPSTAQTEIDALEFPYFTLRNRTGSVQPDEFYGGERSDLKAGVCLVEELDLGVLSPLADVAPNFLQEELLRIQNVRESEPATVLDDLEATAESRGPALYVHGYYIGFEKGCRRAVLFQRNADLQGRFLWFGDQAYAVHVFVGHTCLEQGEPAAQLESC